MESHSERLEKDIVLLRYTYELHRGNDPEFDTGLLSIVTRCVANLAKCKRSETQYLTADAINESNRSFAADFARASGLDGWPVSELVVEEPHEALVQRQTLTDLRRQLFDACEADEPNSRAIGRIATAVIRAEILLQGLLRDAGVYLDRDATLASIDEFVERFQRFSAENFDHETWCRIVDGALPPPNLEPWRN